MKGEEAHRKDVSAPGPAVPFQVSTDRRIASVTIALIVIGAFFAFVCAQQIYRFTAQARYFKSISQIRIVAKALDQYRAKHGEYPRIPNFEAMVANGSPLLKEGLIPGNIEPKDDRGQPFLGQSDKTYYRLKYLGDPGNQYEKPTVTIEPDKP